MAAPPLILPKLTLVILVLSLLISFDQHKHNTKFINNTIFPLHSFSTVPVSLSVINTNNNHHNSLSSHIDSSDSEYFLEFYFYRNYCPNVELIVRSTILRLYQTTPNLVPAIIRLLFHDCFIQGCDASILLDNDDYINSEKESPPNRSLKGFDVIETIKSKLEEACPGVVSCADILVLSARDCVVLAGGPFYPLHTGRRDGSNSFAEIATNELPSPYADLSQTLESFKSRGFDEREMVTLLGAHNIGAIHCKFFENRLYNFSGTNEPDPSLDTEFLKVLRSRCNETGASGYTSHEDQQEIRMKSEESLSDFGMSYYRGLLQGKGILYADQQLMEDENTRYWVQEYASNPTLFHQDFSLAMMKLSDLRVLTMPMGQIRRNCSKVA